MLDSSNGIKHKKRYLHPWNNLPQNAVQTSSPLWRAQRPEDSIQTQEKAVLMCLFTSTTGSSQDAADVYGIRHWYWQHPLTMHAVLHMSAGVLYPAPMSTSKDRYCRVWMSSVKCLCWKWRIGKTTIPSHKFPILLSNRTNWTLGSLMSLFWECDDTRCATRCEACSLIRKSLRSLGGYSPPSRHFPSLQSWPWCYLHWVDQEG